jgi:predicted phosphodiesterase
MTFRVPCTLINLRVRSLLVAAGVAFLVFAGLALMAVSLIRYSRTVVHETSFRKYASARLPGGVAASFKGCFVTSSGPASVHVRAISPAPRMKFTFPESGARPLTVHLSNVPTSHLRPPLLSGGQIVGKGEVRFDLQPEPGETREIALSPAPKDRENFRFYVCGDSHGWNHILDEIMTRAEGDNALFVLELGDFLGDCDYSSEVEERLRARLDFVRQYDVPYLTVLGDADTPDKEQNWAHVYTRRMGPTYHSFSYGNALFIVFDNAMSYISVRQLRWLEDELARSDRYEHVFAFGHQAAFDPRPGRHHCMVPLISGVGSLMNVLEQGGVDVFFAGHLHRYFKTDRNGVTHIITGGAGGSMGGQPPGHHAVEVTVNGDEFTTRLVPFGRGHSE